MESINEKSPKEHIRESFLQICELMTGERKKLTLTQISHLLEQMSDINLQHTVIIGFRIVMICMDAQREIGLQWWDEI